LTEAESILFKPQQIFTLQFSLVSNEIIQHKQYRFRNNGLSN
jgi:hypothetical protein